MYAMRKMTRAPWHYGWAARVAIDNLMHYLIEKGDIPIPDKETYVSYYYESTTDETAVVVVKYITEDSENILMRVWLKAVAYREVRITKYVHNA